MIAAAVLAGFVGGVCTGALVHSIWWWAQVVKGKIMLKCPSCGEMSPIAQPGHVLHEQLLPCPTCRTSMKMSKSWRCQTCHPLVPRL
jgi:uncharacterized C2H2 Zn-finger protein